MQTKNQILIRYKVFHVVIILGLLVSIFGLTTATAQEMEQDSEVCMLAGTVQLDRDEIQSVKTALEKAALEVDYSGSECFAPIELRDEGEWKFITLIGLKNIQDNASWNVSENGAWSDNAIIHYTGTGILTSIAGTVLFSESLDEVPESMVPSDAKQIIDPLSSSKQNAIVAEAYRFPFELGYQIYYGTKGGGVHPGEFSAVIGGGSLAVDLMSDGNAGANHAPNRLLAAAPGTVVKKCSDTSKNSTYVLIDNGSSRFLYAHIKSNTAPALWAVVNSAGDYIGEMVPGNFNDGSCGYADQPSDYFHVHFEFLDAPSLTLNDWTLNTAIETWQRGAEIWHSGEWKEVGGDGSMWTPTGSMSVGRWGATATLLPNGKVLVAGGTDDGSELYDPATGLWTPAGSMSTRRGDATATLLPTGKVLIAGGWVYNNATLEYEALTSAEIYDPATGLWTPTGSMTVAHAAHTATLLPNGKVLVVAGTDMVGKLAIAELYDPDTGLWSTTGSLATAREGPKTILLPNGKVLTVGGWDKDEYQTATAELYDPATGLWVATGSMATARAAHSATLLPNGKVLVAGGSGDSAELYDPATGLWTPTGSMAYERSYNPATLLLTGKVLVEGGFGIGSVTITSAELYDPDTGMWTVTSPLTAARESHTATLLDSGTVLVAGGWSGTSARTSAELYSYPGLQTFTDVLNGYWAKSYVERLYNAGITGGCTSSPLSYCPEASVTRAQMAIFLERGKYYPSSFSPPNVTPTFTDTISHWAEDWIEALKSDGITSGCGTGLYCPEAPVTRAQMAVFLLRAKHGSSYSPPLVGTSTGFDDVPTDHWAGAWIKQLVAESITSGCGSGNYCPDTSVTRAQMAVFLVKTFTLP